MKKIITLLVPSYGFCPCEVDCEPPAVGGPERYYVKSVVQIERDQRTPLDIPTMERMNDIHYQIILQTQGEFAKKELGMNLERPKQKPAAKKKIAMKSTTKKFSMFDDE